MGRVGIELVKGRKKKPIDPLTIKDKHQFCRGLEANLTAQIKKLKADKKELRQLARNLHQFAVHDSCPAYGGDDEECDCGLADYQAMFRRLVR